MPQHLSGNGRRRLDLPQASHWLFAGTGMKEGDGIPGLVGWEWHGDPAPIAGLEVVASGKTKAPCRGDLHGDHLSRPEGELRVQRRHHLVGRRPFRTAGLRPSGGLYQAPRPRRRVQRITANLLDRMRGSQPVRRRRSERPIREATPVALKNDPPPATRRRWMNHGAAMGAAETSSSGKTSSIRKPAPCNSPLSSPQR